MNVQPTNVVIRNIK